MIRVVIAEDHHLVRQGIRSLLDQAEDIKVIGEAEDGQQVIELAERLKPDVIITDLAMPRLSGTQVTEHIRSRQLPSQVVILSMYSDESLIGQALRSGAKGYLLKTAVEEELLHAVRIASRGELYLSSQFSESTLARIVTQLTRSDVPPFDQLTMREKHVLRLVVEGQTNNAIAQILSVSVKTVEKHRSSLMDRLNTHNMAGLVRIAMKHGLIPPAE